jgi:hypothetical protein
MLRRIATWSSALLLGVAILDTAAWWIATQRIIAATPDVVGAAGRSGWLVENGTPTRGGWPFTATVRFPAVAATRPLGGTTLRWNADAIDATLDPLHPAMLRLSLAGSQRITVGGTIMPVQTGTATVQIPMAGGPSIFEIKDVTLTLPNRRPASVRAARITGEVAALAAGFTADDVVITPALLPPFDGPLTLSGGLTMTIGFTDAPTPAASALAWQQAGGRIDVPALMLRWGPLTVTGSGQMSLDTHLQPQGRARLNIEGATHVIDATGRAGLLAPGPEAAARAVLGLLALATQGGPVPVQIDLAERTLTVAQFPLLRLPPIDWDQP